MEPYYYTKLNKQHQAVVEKVFYSRKTVQQFVFNRINGANLKAKFLAWFNPESLMLQQLKGQIVLAFSSCQSQ